MTDYVTHDRQGMFVILGNMIDDAGFPAVEIATAQIFCADFLTRCRLYKRRTRQENRALIADDHTFVGHRRDICTTSGAASHDTGNLRDALGAHICLIEEDTPEMVAVGEDFVLMRQVRAAAVDQIYAGQAVSFRYFLCAQMLFDGHRVVSAALYRRIIAHNHTLTTGNPSNSADQTCPGNLIVIQPISYQLADFEEWRAGVEQMFDAFSGQELSARRVPFTRLFIPAQRCFGHLGPKCIFQCTIVRTPLLEFVGFGVDLAG